MTRDDSADKPAPETNLLTAARKAVHRLNNHLTALSCRCDLAAGRAAPVDHWQQELAVFRQLIDQAINDVRELSRACLDDQRAHHDR